jgi:hypothetical protein
VKYTAAAATLRLLAIKEGKGSAKGQGQAENRSAICWVKSVFFG